MKRDQIINGDPIAEDGIFGVKTVPEQAEVVIIPVPWEMTVSYGRGTYKGPSAILEASDQLDFFDQAFGLPLLNGISLLEADDAIVRANEQGVPLAQTVIKKFEAGQTIALDDRDLLSCNELSEVVNQRVFELANQWIKKKKIVAVLGGDHSSPLGLLRALDKNTPEGFGILHIDAHLDLRIAYEGFKYSHASIMRNALAECPNIQKIVGIGLRDFSKAEYDYASSYDSRYEAWYDRDIYNHRRSGGRFAEELSRRIDELPDRVYISFDIDGLEPSLCPGTGTPVPGGLSFNEACWIIETLGRSGREIIGFDLCEVAPSQTNWDANVGARILYKLAGSSIYSNSGYTA